MSQLIVEVCKIDLLKPHPNADLMEIAVIKGWECCVKKNQFRVGDRVIYFPPDSVLPVALSDKLGITKYLSNGRVKVANLRGYPSMGVLMPLENDLSVGTDVASLYGVTKYEPPIKTTEGDEEIEFSNFHKYYSMENYKNFPNLFNIDDVVSITEKVHGCLEENQKILMFDGREKKIKDIKIDDKIISFNIKSQKFEVDYVTDLIISNEDSEWLELYFDNNRKLICTPNHRILTKNRGWVEAKDINSNDDII